MLMTEFAQTAFRFSAAMPLMGLRQAACIMAPESSESGEKSKSLCKMVTSLDNTLQDLAADVGGFLSDPVKVGHLMIALGHRSYDSMVLSNPPENVKVALTEIANKMQVFLLVINNSKKLKIPTDPLPFPFPLKKYVGISYEQGAYPSLWAIEGLGHVYGDSYMQQKDVPITGILFPDKTADIDAGSLTMLHAGIGLAFAKNLLDELKAKDENASIEDLRPVIKKINQLCHDNCAEGYLGCALESLGLVISSFQPGPWLDKVDTILKQDYPQDARDYYWHGVGRSCYFQGINFIPFSDWQVYQMAKEKATDERARLNAIAGVTWAFTMVGIQHPEVPAQLVLDHHGDELSKDDAYKNGIASSLIMRQDTTPDAYFIKPFYEYQPEGAKLKAHWETLVRQPAEQAISKWYPVLKENKKLDQIFRYGDLAGLVQSLGGSK